MAYNRVLAEWKRQCQACEKPSQAALGRQLNSIKRQQFPWMRLVPKPKPCLGPVQHDGDLLAEAVWPFDFTQEGIRNIGADGNFINAGQQNHGNFGMLGFNLTSQFYSRNPRHQMVG